MQKLQAIRLTRPQEHSGLRAGGQFKRTENTGLGTKCNWLSSKPCSPALGSGTSGNLCLYALGCFLESREKEYLNLTTFLGEFRGRIREHKVCARKTIATFIIRRKEAQRVEGPRPRSHCKQKACNFLDHRQDSSNPEADCFWEEGSPLSGQNLRQWIR